MRFGLSDDIIKKVSKIFSDFSEISEVIIFGSRVKGNYKKGSDIDLALKSTNNKLSLKILNEISKRLDELYLPYTFDLVIYEQIESKDLLDHIDRIGVRFK